MFNFAIQSEHLSKKYRIGERLAYKTFREALVNASSKLLRTITVGSKPARRVDARPDSIWALRDVSFSIKPGEIVGIIGRNGAGKSTLLKILSKITLPTEGRVMVKGRVGSLLEVGTGFHPELTGHENIYLYGAVLGMNRFEISAKYDEIVAFAEIEDFIDTPVKRYSSGMYMRLAFAVAAHLDPEILLVDEVLAVGDTAFQKKCLGKMESISGKGRTVIFVSHSMAMVTRLCQRAILLDQGAIIADGQPVEVVGQYVGSEYGNLKSQQWSNPQDAPGDEIAKLRAVRILDDSGREAEWIDIQRPVTVEVEYWNFQDKKRPTAILHFLNQAGICLFATNEFNSPHWRDLENAPALVQARCTIPGHFFAEGRIFVLAAIGSYNPNCVHVKIPDAVSFQVVDRTDGDGVRGPYSGKDWPGVIRPMLNWKITKRRI